MIGRKGYGSRARARDMRPASLRTSALLLTLIMVLMPMTPFADQNYESSDSRPETNEPFNEQIVMSSGNTGNADSIAFGLQSGCAIGATGSIKCWGNGGDGQLGLGNTQNIGDSSDETGTDLPFVNLGTNASVDKIVMGDKHSCALFTNGSVKCWGESSVLGLGYSTSDGGFGDGYLETGDTLPFLQFPTGRHATMIEAGKSHTCAVMDNDDLICWGDNSKGQLGLGDTDHRGDATGEIGDNFEVTSVPTGRTIDSMALGWDHTCVVWDNYSVSCWGGNDHGQLGLDSTTDIGDGAGEMGDNLDFLDLPGTASAITAGDGFTCAIVDDSGTDRAFCWGLNDFGQLGIENTINVGDGSGGSMSSISNADLTYAVQAIDAGEDHVCAIVAYNTYRPVQCWGNGADGRLGYGSQDSRGTGPGSTSGMGSNLGYVRLTSSNNHYTYSMTDIEVGAGTTCVKSNGYNDVFCWGDNGIGQLGYGDTEDRGDGQTDLPFTTELSLKLDEEVMDNACDILAVPEARDELDKRLDSDSSDTGDLISMFEIPTTGCPAIAYYDSGSGNLKFAAYDNGMWSVETLGSDSGITEIDLVVDSNGVPHIMHLSSTNTYPDYTTKADGMWAESTLQVVTESLSLSIDDSDSITFVRHWDPLTSSIDQFVSYSCSADCDTWSNWNQDSTLNQDTAHFETVDGHQVFIDGSQNGLYYRIDSAGSSYLVSREVSQSDTYMVTSIDTAPDGTVGIAHTNDTTYKTYFSHCSSTCSSSSSWTTELVSDDTSSQVVLQYAADGTPWILLKHNTSGETLFHRENGQWEEYTFSNWPGDSDSFGMIINSAGYIYTSLHLVSAGELWAVTNPTVAGTGLSMDADGDGWIGMRELACGTDRTDSSSTPVDFDMDGHCDSLDTHVDLPAFGDSDVLAQGMDFACAIVNEGDIECWGDNNYGKLGGSASGVSWPAGFTAISIDAGESHACALSAELQIMCWGRNNYGQIGIGTTSASEPPTILNTDTYVQSTYPAWFSSLEVAYHDLAVGANHACALLKPIQFYEDEQVVCWGNGADSQTGQYAVTDSTAGYDDDFETGSPSSIWTLEGTGGQFGSQWTVDTTDASSGSNSFKSNTHQSNSDVGFSITKQFQYGYVSFDFKTDTCPVLTNCNDRFEFSIDNTVMNSTKGQNGWTTYNTTVSQGIHTLRWTFIKDGSSTNDANGDYVAVDNIDIRTGFRIESGGVLDEPQIMDINTNGLVTSIVAGERHTCITNHLEELLCMGYNGGSNHMVLGNSSTTADNSSELVKVDVDFGTSKVKAVSAGYDTSCAILDNSTQAYCWGKRADWSDSTGTTQSGTDLLGSSTNAQISGTLVDLGTAGDRIHSISMGEVHACAVVENTIECWGVEESGSFGMSSSSVDNYSTPQTISVPSGLTAKQVVIEHSTDSTCGVFETSSGAHTVICWGDETAVGYTSSNPVTTLSNAPVEDSNGDDLEMYEISSSPDDIVDLQMGTAHACALSRQGFVKCWGYNGDGELGYGNHINGISPWNGGMAHGDKHPMLYFGQNRTVTQMDIGYDNACALLDDGSISCWGEYRDYMFTNSIGSSGDQYTPLSLTQFGTDNVKVVIGFATVCSLKESGEVYCTGERAGMGYYYTGDRSTPTKVTGAHPTEGKVVDIVAMEDYDSDSGSCAIFESGATKCWGQNTNFQQTRSDWTTPFNFYDMRGILTEDLEVGRHYGCMVVSTTTELNDGESLSPETGEIVCWGEGSYGKTGLGATSTYALTSTSSYMAPLDFNGVSMIDVEIGPAALHTCSISDDREVYCWGNNARGQLGQGNTDAIGDSAGEMSGLNPVDIVGKSKIVALGQHTTCTVTTSNHVYCWGDGGWVNWGHTSANVGDASGEMGTNLRPVPMIMTPYDNDNDGIINLWDTDDDNDGYLDVDDDFDFDECAHLDTDGDGKPDSIVSNCSTDLTEDLDDDNDQWTDIDEQSCLTNSKLITSKPIDTDNDGTCDYIDTDDDNDGWSDLDEQACERKEWNSRQIFGSNYGYDYAYPSGIVWLPNNRDVQFQPVGIGISSEYIRMGGHTTTDIESSVSSYTLHQNYGNGGQQGFDHAQYGSGVYLVNDEKLFHMEYSSTSNYDYPASNEIYTFNSSQQNQHHEIAISDEGSIFLTTNAGIVNIDAGVTSYIDYPTGVSTSSSDSENKQIAVDSNGDLHLISYHSQAARIYTWIYDVSSESWNSGLDSFPGSLSDVGPGRSSFTVDSSNQPHVAFMKGTSASDASSYVTYSYYDNNAQNWVSRFSDFTPSGYNGVSLKLDSNDNVHIAWVDNGNKSLYHTELSSTSNTQSTTLLKQNTYTNYWNSEHKNLEIEISEGDDPWIIWSPYTSQYQFNQIFHYGSAIDESKDSAKYPADHDSDGTCDMLESATLDYGVGNMIFEMEMDLSYMPEYPAMIPTSVSINPALPSGLTLNTTTGEISGKPTTMDLSGTNYVITTDSGVETWSTNLTIKSTMENPMYIGYQTMHGSYDDYTTYSKTAFTNDGDIVTLERYTSSNSITIDGVAVGGNHDSDDIVLSMRNPMGDYLWAKSIRGYDFSIGDVDVDNNGNIYALFSAQARTSDPVEFNFEGVSIDNDGMHTLFLAKWDYYGNLQWVVDTESSGTSQYADIEGNGGSEHLSSPMDLDKATGDVAIIAMGQASNDDLEFGGVSIGPFGTCLTNHQPWVAKVNTNGQVQWTAVGKSNPTSCSNVYDQHVVLHHDGSVTTAGKASGNGGYNFGQHSASTSSNDYGSWIAHADSSGNWAWAENASSKDYVGSTTSRQHWLTMDKFSDDTLFFAFVDKEDRCTELSFAGTKSTLYHSTTSYCMHAVTMNHTNSDVIALETLIGYSHGYTDFISEKVYSAVDSNDIVHVFSDKDNGIDMRTTGFDQGLNTAYDVASSSWSASSYRVTDFGLDHSESIYFTGEQHSFYMYKSAHLLEKCQPGDSCTSPHWQNGQNRLNTGHRLHRFWGDYDHEINYNSPSEGTYYTSRMMGEHSSSLATYQLNNSSGVLNSAALPCGLSFNTGTGHISGTPTNGCTDTANETYTITVTQGSSYAWARNQSFEVTFGIGPAVPVVSYNSADTTQTYTRGVAITPIAPTGITNSGNLHHFTTYPPLPAGLSVNSTGHIIGTPTANQSTAIFKVKSCNSWNICSAGVPFTITINEPAPVISYADSEYEFFKDVPITPVVPTSTGGVPSSWEISPALPTGLSLRGDGAIVGIPFVDSPATNYTIWANNTGGSGTAVLEITINGTGIFINYPYNTAELAQYSPMMALYPSTSGAAIVSWSIEPTLPSGIFFGTNNGTIWGTPSTLTESAVYTINATGVEDYGTATVTISVLVDTDLDGIPDINDDDIDGDGWSNVDETNCLTDEMDENDYPSDIDQDRICDLLDTSDDRAIIVIYLDNSLELAINSTINPLVPITAGGDITSWAISPALPLGLEFNGTMPGRSTSDTGTISGTPTELSDATIYTIWANNSNSGQSGTFQITLSVLEDTDGDGIPDVYDDDMDGDGWSNEMENLCGEDPQDASSTPVDTDGDGLCNYIDSDDDNDSFIDTDEIMCNSDSLDASSVPIDDDNDGICDALQSDRDLDGWADGPEESCGSDPDDASSVPVDSDGDMICDSQDDDRDGDGVGNNVDDFPDDRSASKDTDGDGKPDSLSGASTSDPPLVEDFDDDNDNWSDYDETMCGTNPLDESDFPTDSDGDGTCDALEDDTDGDGVADAEDAFPMDSNEWLDTDGDGVGNNADGDDDGDNWSDADEDRCGSDSLDSESIPANIEEDGTCVATKTSPKDDGDDDSSSSTMWWLCVCLPLLLLLLLIPLLYVARERGDSLLVMVGVRNGPEPENTTSRPQFKRGSGTKNDPFVLRPAHVENFGDSVTSKESITISKLDPDTLITITDMAASTNRGRFNMDSIIVEGNADEKGTGSVVFNMMFDDNVTEDDVSGVYTGQIRVGSASVYLLWEVTVGDPEADELAAADLRAAQLKAEEEAELKAIEEAEAKAKAEKEAAEKAKAEKEAAEKKAKEEAEAEAKAKAEKEAAEALAKADAEAKAKAEKEAAEKKAKEEADAKAKAEADEKLRIAEEKAAAAEAKAAAAEEKAAAEKKAKEEAEDAARVAAEKAAQERLEQMEKEMEERRKKLEQMDEAARKKEEELLRISEKAKSIDFTTLGVAARSVASKPVEKGATEVSIGDTSDFEEAGSAWVQDDEGGMNISWTGKTATALTGVKGLKRGFAAAATVTASDDLQKIKGVGPFIEDKLNALGIYTFEQVGNMTAEIEEQVNVAIEFFPGRIKRDKWANQARKFAKQK